MHHLRVHSLPEFFLNKPKLDMLVWFSLNAVNCTAFLRYLGGQNLISLLYHTAEKNPSVPASLQSIHH